MSKQREYLREVMDKATAVLECGAGSHEELAAFVRPHAPEKSRVILVYHWMQGRRNPNGESALRIHKWLEAKTLEISAGSIELRDKYFAAFAKTPTGKRKEKAK